MFFQRIADDGDADEQTAEVRVRPGGGDNFRGWHRRARAPRARVVGARNDDGDARKDDGERGGSEGGSRGRETVDAGGGVERLRGTGTERRGTEDAHETWTRVRGCEFGDALPEPWARRWRRERRAT